MKTKTTIESKVREIKRAAKRKFSAEEKIRIVLEVLRADDSLSAICRREGIHPNLYYNWSKEFLEAGKKRLNGDIQRQATSNEVVNLKEENNELKHIVVEQALNLRAYKKKSDWYRVSYPYMRRSFNEKREIIRIVEQSELSLTRICN